MAIIIWEIKLIKCYIKTDESSVLFVRSFDGRRFLYLPESKEALSPGPQGPTPTAEPKDSQIVYHTNINHKYEATDSGSLEAVATWHVANPGGLGRHAPPCRGQFLWY